MAVVDQDRIRELKAALAVEVEKQDAVVSAIRTEEKSDEGDGGIGYVVTPEMRDEFKASHARALEIKAALEIEEGYGELKAFMDAPMGRSAAMAAEAGGALPPMLNAKSVGELFLDSEEFKAFKATGGYTMANSWEITGVDMGGGRFLPTEQKDVYTSLPGTMTTLGFGKMQIDPIVPQQFRTRRVRDLFPVVQTDANLIDFFRVTGFTNNASVVPERVASAFGLKPQSTLTFEVRQAPVRTIAHWEVAHRTVLDDEPQLRGIIDNELLYGLRLHEDYQILNGTGTGEDLTGILQTEDVQTYDGQAGSDVYYADTVRKSATKVMLANYEPTGVVLHPNDWETIELTKDQQDRYVVTVSVAVGAEQRLWRLPVVDTPAYTQGTCLVGAFGLGAQLYDRQVGNIRIAEQHEDFFVRNAVVILAEERLALAVKRPESFCIGTFHTA